MSELVKKIFLETVISQIFDEDESSSSSSSSSNSSDDETMIYRRKQRNSASQFVEKQISTYDEVEFKQNFRLSRETAFFVIDLIRKNNIFPSHTFGREKVTPEKGFFVTLWYLANTETYRQVSNRFDISLSTCHKYVTIVIEFLVSCSKQFIKWPAQEDYQDIASNFATKRNIPDVIGAIDGSHIPIVKPYKDQEAYCNRKGWHSVILQGVCDFNKKFIDIYCGEPGSLHDARVLKHSTLYKMIMEERIVMGKYHLLGDSAYPNLKWLITPFKDNGHLNENQRTFNFRHSSTRIVIENAFGLLKTRFRRLKGFNNYDIAFVNKATIAACVLHNICITYDDFMESEVVCDNDESHITSNNTVVELSSYQDNNKRERIFNQMFS